MEEESKYGGDEMSYDQAIGRLIDLRQEEDDSRWKQGALCVYLIDMMGQKASWIASQINCSAAQVREIAKTWRAFPTEEMRVPYSELSWMHFRIAAGTQDPPRWIELAAEKGWSIRELKKAIKGEPIKDELRDAERAWARVEKLLKGGGPGAEWLEKKITEKYTLSQSLDHAEESVGQDSRGGQVLTAGIAE